MNAEENAKQEEQSKEPAAGAFQTFLKEAGLQAKSLGTNASGIEMISVEAKDIEAVASKLKKEKKLTTLAYMTALEIKSGYQVIYQFEQQMPSQVVQVKVTVPKDSPVIPSLYKLFASADWQEREAFDMIGVKFDGHPNLVRILNPDNWEGHPLTKSYVGPVDELNQALSYSK